MDKNVVNVSYYDTEKQTGGQFQFCPEIGNEVIRNLIEANLKKPKSFTVGIVFPDGISKKLYLERMINPQVVDRRKYLEGARKNPLDVLYPHRQFLNMDVIKSMSNPKIKQEGFKMYNPKFTTLAALDVPNIADIYVEKIIREQIKHNETEVLKKLPKPLIIMFNAPPRAGKDTACKILMRRFPESVNYEYFKEYLYKESAKVLGLDFNFWASVCQSGDLKDKPMLQIQTDETNPLVTPRDILINVAENILKPKHGKDCIANATAHKIAKTIQQFKAEKGYNPIIVVPDLGFPYEADAVRTIIPSAEVAVVHIKREGYTFEGDSRNYVPKAKYRIENTTLKAFEESVLSILSTEVQDIMAKHCWLK